MEQDDLALARDGAYIAGALPYIDDDIQLQLKRIDREAQRADPLTPELAFSLWAQRLAYVSILRKLKQRVEIGVSKAVTMQETLDFEATNPYK